MLLHKMHRYRVVRNKLVTAIIHIDAYLMILGLIKRELQCLDLDNNKKIRLRLAYLEF